MISRDTFSAPNVCVFLEYVALGCVSGQLQCCPPCEETRRITPRHDDKGVETPVRLAKRREGCLLRPREGSGDPFTLLSRVTPRTPFSKIIQSLPLSFSSSPPPSLPPSFHPLAHTPSPCFFARSGPQHSSGNPKPRSEANALKHSHCRRRRCRRDHGHRHHQHRHHYYRYRYRHRF